MAYAPYAPDSGTSSDFDDDVDMPDDNEMRASGIAAINTTLSELSDRVAKIAVACALLGEENTFAETCYFESDVEVTDDVTVGDHLDVGGDADVDGSIDCLEAVTANVLAVHEDASSPYAYTLDATASREFSVDLSKGQTHFVLTKTNDVAHRVAFRLDPTQLQIGGVYHIGIVQTDSTGSLSNNTICYLSTSGAGLTVLPAAATDTEAIEFDTTGAGATQWWAFFEIRVFPNSTDMKAVAISSLPQM